ncbi:MAG TPA: hypothetical protein VFZ61_03640 [Polyangiales bacterium]
MADETVRVVSPDGKRGEIPAANLMEAISKGFTPEAEYDAAQQEAALQAEYGGFGGQLVAGAQGAARGLTLGVSDVASAALTGGALALSGEGPQLTPEARQRMLDLGMAPPEQKGAFSTGYDAAREYQDAIRAANPGTAITSEIGGALLPALATAGGSTGLSLAPAALAERAGAAVGKGLAGSAPGIGRAALAGAAGGAAEGALAGLSVGATRLNTEATPEEAAESLISAGTEGLLIGGGIGGLLGGATRALSGGAQALAREGAEAAQDVAQAAPTEVLPPGSRHPADIDGITLDLEARPLTAAGVPDPVRGRMQTLVDRQRAAQGGFDQAVAEGTAALRQDVDDVLRQMNQVDEFAGIAAKRRANELNVQGPVSSHEVDGVLGAMREVNRQFLERNSMLKYAGDGGVVALQRVGNMIDDGQKVVAEALRKGDIGEAYAQLDNIKRSIGRARGTRSASVQDLMEEQYKRVQQFMEDEELWGELAQRQKLANPAWADRISAGQDARIRGFTSKAGGNLNRAANEWDQLDLANSSALSNLLQNVGDVRVADVEEAFRRNLRAMARDATDRTRAWGAPELQARAVNIVNAVKRIEDKMDAVALLRRDALKGTQQLRSASMDALASVAGMVSPAAGWAISGTARLGRGLLASVSEAGSGIRGRVAQSAAALAAGAAKGSALVARTAPVVGSSQGMMAEADYQRAIEESQQLSQAGSPATQELFQQGAEIERTDPQLADAYVTKQLGRAAYIASKLPKPLSSAAVFAPKPVLDPLTDRKLRRSIDAAYQPAAALERIAKMMGTPQDVDALKKLYPAMYKSFQQQAVEHLKQLDKPLDYQTAVRVSMLTGIQTVPGMAPSSVARAQRQAAESPTQEAEQAAAANRKAKGGPSMGGRDRDNVYAAHADRLMSRQ